MRFLATVGVLRRGFGWRCVKSYNLTLFLAVKRCTDDRVGPNQIVDFNVCRRSKKAIRSLRIDQAIHWQSNCESIKWSNRSCSEEIFQDVVAHFF